MKKIIKTKAINLGLEKSSYNNNDLMIVKELININNSSPSSYQSCVGNVCCNTNCWIIDGNAECHTYCWNKVNNDFLYGD